MTKYEIVTFVKGEVKLDVNVSPSEDTVWMTKDQMSVLFGRDRSVISRHIKNIFEEKELDETTSVHFLHISQKDLPNHRPPEYYNLDVVISVGYRVKSNNGVLFRKWANGLLKEYLLKGYVINENRTLITNENYINLINKVDSIDKRLTSVEKINIEKERIFFDGDFFDAKFFISNIISRAKKSIILIDAYADVKALEFLKYKKSEVNLLIYHSSKARLSNQDVNDFNNQYKNCSTFINEKFHDRFLIIDDEKLYHLGASLNYSGKKIFAITKIEDKEILELIKGNL